MIPFDDEADGYLGVYKMYSPALGANRTHGAKSLALLDGVAALGAEVNLGHGMEL
jgi:hypothetical protein